jgi:PKD repeat protein
MLTNKGKSVVSFSLAAIMLALIFGAMVPMGVASSNGGNFNIIDLTSSASEKVLRGQNLYFTGAAAAGITIYRFVAGELANTYTPDSDGKIFNVNWPLDGAYYVSANPATPQYKMLSYEAPNLPLKFRVGDKEVTSVAVTSRLRIDTGGINLFDNDKVSLVIIDSSGVTIKSKNGQQFDRISVADLKKFGSTTTDDQINTTGWKIGAYTFQIKTKPENACGLIANSGAAKSFMIIKKEISIAADKTSAVQGSVIKLTVTGVAGHSITLSTSDMVNTVFLGGVNDNPTTDTTGFSDTIQSDSTNVYAVKFADTGTYTITVKDDDTGEDDTVDITVTEKGVTFDVPTTVVIGQKFILKGTANTGQWVQIAVDNIICGELSKLVLDENKEFLKEIDTSTACNGALTVPGSVRLKAFIDTDYSGDVTDKTDDGSVAILMTRGDLTAALSTESVAQADDFRISGKAQGSKEVDIVIVSPKGAGGSTIVPGGTELAKGVYHTSTSVSTTDNTYTKKIEVGGDVDTGRYLIVVLSKGGDGVYGNDAANTDLTKALAGYNLIAKTQEQILAIAEDATSGAAGSDDLMYLLYIKVEIPYVELDPIESVIVGEPLVVTGTSNRKEGFAIVVTAKGPTELSPKTVLLEKGKFSATFDTTDAPLGTYVVKVDDGDGHIDTTTVEIIAPENYPPTAIIDSITPNPAKQDKDTISFIGHGNDSDGSVVAYNWSSSIEGLLNISPSFTIPASELSIGVHTIYFTVQDDGGAWSFPATENLTILTNQPPVASFSYLPVNPSVNETVTFNASFSFDPDGNVTSYNWSFGDGNLTNTTGSIITHSYGSVGEYTVNLTVTDNEGATNRNSQTIKVFSNITYFDTELGTYPSISGTHNGTITMTHTVNVSKIYLYPCTGTGGHVKYARIWNESWDGAEARWDGYVDDWHNCSFDKNFTLVAGETYNYTIRTDSYPQIHHTPELLTAKGWITCTSFLDINGKRHEGGIPAIRLE